MAEAYHEALPDLSEEAKNTHRAIQSLVEELQAVDWYNQRVEVAPDEELKEILAHNRDEEIEHASMILEWLRRNMSQFDEQLKTYLFTSGRITELEEAESEEEESGKTPTEDGTLGIGKIEKGE